MYYTYGVIMYLTRGANECVVPPSTERKSSINSRLTGNLVALTSELTSVRWIRVSISYTSAIKIKETYVIRSEK